MGPARCEGRVGVLGRRERTERLDEMSAEFAVRRMNGSLESALRGRRAEELGTS